MNYKLLYKLLKKYIKTNDINSIIIVNKNSDVSQEEIYYYLKVYEINNYISDSKICNKHQRLIIIQDIEKEILILENKILKQKLRKLKRENDYYHNNVINSLKANKLLCEQVLKGGVK